MKVTTDINNLNGRYHAQVATSDPSGLESDLLAQYGDPIIEVGGNVTDTVDGTDVDFDLPTKQRRMIADFPVKEVFDLEDDADSAFKAKAWTIQVQANLQTALTALKANETPPTYEGQTTTTIS